MSKKTKARLQFLKGDEIVTHEIIAKPVGRDKHGLLFKKEDIDVSNAKRINSNDYFSKKVKTMTQDLEKASKTTDEAIKVFSEKIDKFYQLETDFAAKSKKAASNIKDAEEKLLQGINRVQKSANFDTLERYVSLLERSADAMERLAELERTGKLEKITNALR